MKKWEVEYDGNKIVVENRMSGERLIVNDVLQDECLGFAVRERLWGKLPNGEVIKISIGGWWSMHCRIFVDHELITPTKR